jgi:hypothetical protein
VTAAPLDTVDAVRAEVRRVDEYWPTQIHGLLARYDRVAATFRDRSDLEAVDLAVVVAHTEHCRRRWDGAGDRREDPAPGRGEEGQIATHQYPRGAGRGMGGTPSGH